MHENPIASPDSHASLPLITIVTVCFNAEKFIEGTMKSVLEQTYPNVEYLIIDGGSKDHTMDIVRRMTPLFEEKKYRMVTTSEPDRGIYDAMNKGIAKAQGEWVNFMNAGDYFNDSKVLSQLFEEKDYTGFDILYGDTYMNLAFGKILMAPKSIDYLHKKMAFCHQSVFVRSSVLRKHPFDLQYKLAADYESFYHFYTHNLKFKYCQMPISVFDSEYGASSANRLQVNREYAHINGKDRKWYWTLQYGFKCFSVKMKNLFYASLPEKTVARIRERNYERLSKRRMK